ncbi:DeoR/GlpR family DNA-binding transcription regulator [Dyella telluris]|uniref:DeoR/GlpR transcriptional regulator n=1 Tax=Dyella telluris TaxID=2763498 RepID=A0A7G8Q3S7_9GAMM|nr:DeoR/GlpR family DNA-binding transcription regulator [Dyella telluris]QNK01435.1 DeoR/GlpR transcriptional regulator [Dyella telluris]
MLSKKPDIPLARRDLIADRLAKGQAVVATELATEFDVSEDAIRRDLRALAAEGRCRRVYGGALPLSPADRPMAARMDEAREQKAALGRAAAATITQGELVFLDSGSTNLAIVDALPEDFDLTIVTNSIDIAAAALRRSDLKLIMIGGSVDVVVGGAIDATAISGISDLNIGRCFLGACSVSTAGGVYAINAADAAFKRVLVAASQHTTVLATNDKFETSAPYRVAAIEDIACFVVEHDMPSAESEALKKKGAKVLKAKRAT